jgi:hypothetical protein
MLKEYNFQRHYETKHVKFSGKLYSREKMVKTMGLKEEPFIRTKCIQEGKCC